jgi:protein-S-isoprenylcysteine O-methyltransferase Ste14
MSQISSISYLTVDLRLFTYTVILCEIVACISKTQRYGEAITSTPVTSMILGICPSSSKTQLYPNATLPFLAHLGCLIFICGALIRLWSQLVLSAQYTWEVTVLPDHKLVTEAPYSIVRHPMYTGSFLVFLAQIMIASSSGTYLSECFAPTYPRPFIYIKNFFLVGIIISVITLIKRTVKEDELLEKTFGKEWEDWAKKATYRLLPGIF